MRPHYLHCLQIFTRHVVYALYNRSLGLGICLVIWFFLCRAHDTWIFIVAPPTMKANAFCITQKTVKEMKRYGWVSFPHLQSGFVLRLWLEVSLTAISAVIVFNQFLLWALTYWKYRRIRQQTPRWPELQPILRLVMRDNSWSFLVLGGECNSYIHLSFINRLTWPVFTRRDFLPTSLFILYPASRTNYILVCSFDSFIAVKTGAQWKALSIRDSALICTLSVLVRAAFALFISS